MPGLLKNNPLTRKSNGMSKRDRDLQSTSTSSSQGESPTEKSLRSATEGFDLLFSNRLADARTHLAKDESPFHLLGLGVCTFLEAALGMEANLFAESARCLSLSEAAAKKQIKMAKSPSGQSRFPPGLEWEITLADAVVLLGLTHALSESYMGYLQCLYSLNNAHSKFTKLYKTVFPKGLDAYATPAQTPAQTPTPSRNPSQPNLNRVDTTSTIAAPSPTSPSKGSFFSRWGLSSSSSSATNALEPALQPEGPVEELVVSGAAFGFGLFNLVFSLLPAKVQSVVGFLGFQHDRRLALQALAVSAARSDVHSVFAGLTLMTYHGVVLLLAGYQADEMHIVKQYRAIVDKVAAKYPDGSLWILNRAKILRMTYDPDGAIEVLKEGLSSERPGHFKQADALLVFELAWTLLSQRRYEEAAEMFIRMMELNTWSHATYCAIIGGCYVSVGNKEKAKHFFGLLPSFLDKRKYGGKELPTEILVRKKMNFYKKKQKRRGGDEADFIDCMKLSFAEEMAIFWNTHERITRETALAHIHELSGYTPAVTVKSPFINHPYSEKGTLDVLDTLDELAIRSLILGIVHRTLGEFTASRELLEDAHKHHAELDSNWVGGVALFELAVLDLKEAEANDKTSSNSSRASTPPAVSNGHGKEQEIASTKVSWPIVLKSALDKLEQAMALSGSHVELSSRLDTRVNMLRDEIALKREMLGLS